MTDPTREALAHLLDDHEVGTYHGGWSCKCGAHGTVDYIDHLTELISAEFLIVPRSEVVGQGWENDADFGPARTIDVREKADAAMPMLDLSLFEDWLRHGERGLSSNAIVRVLSGVRTSRHAFDAYPMDTGDFRRCERLLRAVPAAREHFSAMKACGPVWSTLVDAWPELVELAESEAPGYLGGTGRYRPMPRFEARMDRAFQAARKEPSDAP